MQLRKPLHSITHCELLVFPHTPPPPPNNVSKKSPCNPCLQLELCLKKTLTRANTVLQGDGILCTMSYRRVRRLELTVPSLRDPRAVPGWAPRRRGRNELADDQSSLLQSPAQLRMQKSQKLPDAFADHTAREQDAPSVDQLSDCGNPARVELWLENIVQDPAPEVLDFTDADLDSGDVGWGPDAPEDHDSENSEKSSGPENALQVVDRVFADITLDPPCDNIDDGGSAAHVLDNEPINIETAPPEEEIEHDMISCIHDIEHDARHSEPDDVGFDIFDSPLDDAVASQQDSGSPGTTRAPEPLSHSRRTLDDSTTEERHTPSFPCLSAFKAALMLWEQQHHVSRRGHRELVEVLQMLSDVNELRSLPVYKDTLNRRLQKSLPLLPLRRRRLNLDMNVMPNRTKSTEDVLSFDLRAVLQTFLSSPQNMKLVYRGMAKLIEGPVLEPWGESIRTTSGHCIKDASGHPFWPSDCVWWHCDNTKCEKQHIGRITWCGHDFTGRSNFEGKPSLCIQEMFSTLSLPRLLFELRSQANFHNAIEESNVPLQSQEKFSEPQELVIIFDQDQLISPT